MSFSRQGVLILLEDLRQALNLNKIKQALRSCFEFLQKVFLGLMYLFSCVLWAIFWSFSLLIFLITEAKMPQKLIQIIAR